MSLIQRTNPSMKSEKRSIKKSVACGELSVFGDFGVGNPVTIRKLKRMIRRIHVSAVVFSLIFGGLLALRIIQVVRLKSESTSATRRINTDR